MICKYLYLLEEFVPKQGVVLHLNSKLKTDDLTLSLIFNYTQITEITRILLLFSFIPRLLNSFYTSENGFILEYKHT